MRELSTNRLVGERAKPAQRGHTMAGWCGFSSISGGVANKSGIDELG